MRLSSFRARGYRSLKDVELKDLRDINVLHGLNNVGKSNTLRAIDFLLNGATDHDTNGADAKLRRGGRELMYKEASDWFHQPGDREFELEATIALREDELRECERQLRIESGTLKPPIAYGIRVCTSHESSYDYVAFGDVWFRAPGYEYVETPSDRREQALASKVRTLWPLFKGRYYQIGPFRRVEEEADDAGPDSRFWWPGALIGLGEGRRIKRALFEASHSADPRIFGAYERLIEVLASPPFSFGRLSLARDPETRKLDVFVGTDRGRLPLSSLGSGPQQLVMQLFSLFIAAPHASILAIEEPENHLHWETQRVYYEKLCAYVRSPDALLEQLLISSHAPFFENVVDNFYSVSHDGTATSVRREPYEKAREPNVGLPEMYRVTKVLGGLVIRLPDEVAADMKLRPGDRIFFDKRRGGSWELLDRESFERRNAEVVPDVVKPKRGPLKPKGPSRRSARGSRPRKE